MELQAHPDRTTFLEFLHSSKSCSVFLLICLENAGRDADSVERPGSKSFSGITCVWKTFHLLTPPGKAKSLCVFGLLDMQFCEDYTRIVCYLTPRTGLGPSIINNLLQLGSKSQRY